LLDFPTLTKFQANQNFATHGRDRVRPTIKKTEHFAQSGCGQLAKRIAVATVARGFDALGKIFDQHF